MYSRRRWGLIGIGVDLTLFVEVVGIPSLPFAVGVYLPLATMVPVYLGGLLRHFAEKTAKNEDDAAQRREKGVLFGSGLVGGEGLLGVGIAFVAGTLGRSPKGLGTDWAGPAAPWLAAALFAGLIIVFWRLACQRDGSGTAKG